MTVSVTAMAIISFITALIVSIFPSLGGTQEIPEYYEDDPQYLSLIHI